MAVSSRFTRNGEIGAWCIISIDHVWPWFHDTVTLAQLEKGFMTLLHWQNWKKVSWHDVTLAKLERVSWHCYTGKTGKGFLDTITLAKQKKGFMTLLVLHWQIWKKVFMTLLHWQNWKRVLWHCYTGKTGKCWQSKLKRGSFYRQQRILRLYMWILPPWLVKVVLPTARH